MIERVVKKLDLNRHSSIKEDLAGEKGSELYY